MHGSDDGTDVQQIFRVIFQLKDLKRASGMEGQLKSTTLRPDTAPVRFLTMDSRLDDFDT